MDEQTHLMFEIIPALALYNDEACISSDMQALLFHLLFGSFRHSAKSAQVVSQPFAIKVQLLGSMEIMFPLLHDLQLTGKFVGERCDNFGLA